MPRVPIIGSDDKISATHVPDTMGRKRDNLIALFSVPCTGVSVECASTSKYYLYQSLKSGKRLRYTLEQVITTAGNIFDIRVVDLLHSAPAIGVVTMVDSTDSGITYTSTGSWSALTQSGTYGGTHRRSLIAGDYAQWTSPSTCTGLGVSTAMLSNTGVMAVSIDGSLTAATLLPTAQDLVTAGTLDAAALTTNGGTLAPTTRCIDEYSASAIYDNRIKVVEGLAAAAHVIRVTNTGYKRAASADFRIYVDAFIWYDNVATTIESVELNLTPTSTCPFTYALQVDIGGTATFVGNGHGYDNQATMTIELDGAVLALTAGQSSSVGQEVVVTRTSNLQHPNSAGANIATTKTEFRLRPQGLTITNRVVFSITSAGNNKFEMPMMAVNSTTGAFDKGRTLALSADAVVTGHAGINYGEDTVSDTAFLWQSAGRMAALVTIPDPVMTFGSDTMSVYIQDRDAALIAKVYFERREPITSGQIWRSQATYQFADLANPELLLGAS